jgi:glycine C-acetyltransferase
VDIFNKFRANQGEIGQYAKQIHGYFAFPKLEGEIAPRMKFRGKEVLNWSLNNYLGLANHPEVRKADAEAAAQYGMAYPMGARMMSGQTTKHEELERELASFVGKPDAFLLNYGYQGMVSVIDAICGRNDVIVYDAESHACILDGVRLHMGKRFVFLHNNMESLRKQLTHATRLAEKQKGGVLVITEGVFGMAGDVGKLDEIAALKDEFEFRLLVDDAHGFGMMGKTSAGTGEHFGVQDKIDLYFATFAKAMAGIGGFIACDTDICYYLRYNMRSQTYAKSLPMPMVIGGLKRLELIRTKPELKEKLWTVVENLQKGLREAGFDLGRTNSAVTPVFMKGGIFEATNMVYDLRENYGIFVRWLFIL